MTDSLWLWIGFNAFVLVMLALDLGVFHRKSHVGRVVSRVAEEGCDSCGPAQTHRRMMIVALEIFIVLLLFTANGLFAMMEMAIVSSRKSRLKQMAEAGDARALVALGLAEAPNRFLPTVQIGITLLGLLAGAFSGITLAEEITAGLKSWPALAPYAGAIAVGLVVIAP